MSDFSRFGTRGMYAALGPSGGSQRMLPSTFGAAMPGSGLMRTAGATGVWGAIGGAAAGAVTGAITTTAERAVSALHRWIVGSHGIVTSPTGRLLGVMRGGRLMRNKQVWAAAKQIGVDGTASALGVSQMEVAMMVMSAIEQRSRSSKRGRGISARDVRVTRRTIHKIRSIEHSLVSLAPRARSAKRTRSAPASFVRQG